MVNDNSVSEREETRCRHMGYSFRLAVAHTTAFVTLVVEHWLEREVAQWVHPMKDRSDEPSHHERTLHLAPHFETYSILRYSDH